MPAALAIIRSRVDFDVPGGSLGDEIGVESIAAGLVHRLNDSVKLFKHITPGDDDFVGVGVVVFGQDARVATLVDAGPLTAKANRKGFEPLAADAGHKGYDGAGVDTAAQEGPNRHVGNHAKANGFF